jgi:GNAT superfamily N-acetyltransferase
MIFRTAFKKDVPALVAMLANDSLGQWRENIPDPLPEQYYTAFQIIDNDPNQELIVVENDDGAIIGTMQLSFIQYLTYQGGMRMQIEGVRVRNDQRGKGIGEKIFAWAIDRAKEKGAHLVQLTSDKRRADAIRFYEKLGFVASHEGMKLHL